MVRFRASVRVAGVTGLSWRLAPADDASAFTLSSDGKLRLTNAKNFEADTQRYSLQLEISDDAGRIATQALTVLEYAASESRANTANLV